MGPGRLAVVVDEVRQRLFNKHFDEGYSADDLWKQKRRWIGVARHLLRENAAMEHVVGCWRCSGGLWTSALPRTWTRYSESCVKCTRYASMSPPSVVICTPQNREASGTASFSSHVYASLSHHMCVRCVSKLRHHTFLPLSLSVSLRCRGGGGER